MSYLIKTNNYVFGFYFARQQSKQSLGHLTGWNLILLGFTLHIYTEAGIHGQVKLLLSPTESAFDNIIIYTERALYLCQEQIILDRPLFFLRNETY